MNRHYNYFRCGISVDGSALLSDAIITAIGQCHKNFYLHQLKLMGIKSKTKQGFVGLNFGLCAKVRILAPI
jgi:hypothetical protein